MTWASSAAIRVFLTLTLTAIYAVASSPAFTAEWKLKEASFMPVWSPQAQFAGYYMALDKGFYRKHGIDLTILKSGPNTLTSEYLQSGKADFAVLWLTTAIHERAAGVKLVNLAQIIQKSSMMLVARKSSGITTPADMNGKRVGLWGGPFAIPVRGFFKQYGLCVHEITQGYTVNLFLGGGIDVASAMWYNEYHTILNAGLDADELSIFLLKDYGIDVPEDGLYALEKTLKNDPTLAKGFAQASLEGWEYASAHLNETLDVVIRHMREAKLPANRMQQKWMLDRMRDVIIPRGSQGAFGRLSENDYNSAGQILLQNGEIRTIPDFKAFTGRFDVQQ